MKKDNIGLIVIGTTIIMFLIVLIGSTFAYFTSLNNKESTSVISVTSGKMTISYADGNSKLLSSKDIVPSNKIVIDKTFTLTGTNTTSGLAMPYRVGLKYISEFSDGQIHYYVKRTNTNANVTSALVGTANQTIPGNTTETGYTTGTLKKGNKYQELATGEFKANTSNQTITFNLKIQFPDTGVSQDSEKGKTLTGEIVVNYEDKHVLLEYISELDKASNGLEIDDTPDKNLRYVGASPKNYINFNKETWRIIGVFNNITTIDEQGNTRKESLVKIVRNESLGNYSWDSSESGINRGYGVNEWSQADLMTELKTDYIDTSKTSGTTLWFNGKGNAKNRSYYYSKNIKSNFIDKLAKVRWNTNSPSFEAGALNSYNQERSTISISTPSDNVPRTNTWDGKVALIYPSDYGYASTDTTCRNNMFSSINNIYNCKNENWLFKNLWYWTLSTYSDDSTSVFLVDGGGAVSGTHACDSNSVFPAVFLKSDILIASGNGEEGSPYLIG